MKTERPKNGLNLNDDGTPTGGAYEPLLKESYDNYRMLMTKFQNKEEFTLPEAITLAGYFEKILAAYDFNTGKPRTDVNLGLSGLVDIPKDRLPVFKERLHIFIDTYHGLVR